MSHPKIGRNDPCPCGSGKKYKRCHWAQNQDQPPPPGLPETEDIAPLDFAGRRRQMQAVKAAAGKDAEFGRLLATVELLADYQTRLPAIEAAEKTLAGRRAEFEALWNDQPALAERARRLFAEERFAPLRFQVADVQRAFARVGYPGLAGDPQTLTTLLQAILHLADDDWRRMATVQLMVTLPEYVAARQYPEAYLIRSCAMLTDSEKNESNPFLYEMFQHGLLAWDDQRRQFDGALLAGMGLDLDRMRNLSTADIEAVMAQVVNDPQKLKQVKAYMAAHPEARAAMEAQSASSNALSIALLDREDSWPLLPTMEETLPWLERFHQGLVADPRLAVMLEGKVLTKENGAQLAKLLFSLSDEMARTVFTPARVTQLKSQLAELAAQHKAAGDLAGRSQAEAALMVLARDTREPDHHFLSSICYTAFRNAMGGGPNRSPAANSVPPTGLSAGE